MRVAEFNTINDIAQEIVMEDIETLEGFVNDCRHIGFYRTARYVADRVRREIDPNRDKIIMLIAEDFSGV